MCNISCGLDSFYFVFLLFLLVSILFSVSNRFVWYFRLLKFTLRKNRLNTVYASDSIQQERLPVSLEVGRILLIIRPIYVKAFVAKVAKKLEMQVNIGIRFRHSEITYFEINRLHTYAKQIISKAIHFNKH